MSTDALIKHFKKQTQTTKTSSGWTWLYFLNWRRRRIKLDLSSCSARKKIVVFFIPTLCNGSVYSISLKARWFIMHQCIYHSFALQNVFPLKIMSQWGGHHGLIQPVKTAAVALRLAPPSDHHPGHTLCQVRKPQRVIAGTNALNYIQQQNKVEAGVLVAELDSDFRSVCLISNK